MDWDYGVEEHARKEMVDIIWEETLGRNQTQDDSSNIINDDILFEFKDPDNPTTTEIEIGFDPLDLSDFPGYSDELPKVLWHAFKGDHDNATHNVEWFMSLASEYGIKEKEYVGMRSFVLHLGGNSLVWFVCLDKGTISSFGELVETFCSHWDSKRRDEWIPHVKHERDLFSKETQNKDQVKVDIV